MSEGSSGIGLGDARQFIYLPKWVKIIVLVISGVLFILASASIYVALTTQAAGDSIVFFVSVAQAASLLLAFFLVLLYSRRDANVGQLHVFSDEFLRTYVGKALAKVSIPDLNLVGFDVRDEGAKDIFGRLLTMTNGDYKFKIWVGLNVRRIFVIYFVPLTDSLSVEDLKRIYQFTFGGATKVGYACNFEEAQVNDTRICSIWLTVSTEGDFLTSPQDKLFWAQDVAMMTESFLRTSYRNNVALRLDAVSPGPL